MVINKKYLLLAVVVLGLVFSGAKVFAAQDNKAESIMTISPPKQKILLAPGEKFEGTIKVSNSSNAQQDLKYSVTIGSYGIGKDENGKVDYEMTDVDTVTNYNQIMEWITLGKENGTVAPNETDTIPFTIDVPNDAPAGGQYASIIVQDDTGHEEGQTSGNGVMIQGIVRFASSIIAEVSGETREEGEIIENTLPAFLLNSSLEANSLVKNNGNVHTDAEYILQVWPLFNGEEICTNEEKPETSLILPETERYHVQSCNLPSFGIFRAKQTVKIFGETSTMERVVFVCPLWLLFLIIFIIVALVIWLITKIRANRTNRAKSTD